MSANHCMLLVPLALVLASCGGGPTKPTPEQMQQPVGDYLVEYKKSSCDGAVTLDKVEVKRIGDFGKQFGGFPVFADFSVTCAGRREGAVTASSTFVANDGATTKAAVCYARAAGKGYECFMPELVKDFERQMQQKVEEMMRKLPK